MNTDHTTETDGSRPPGGSLSPVELTQIVVSGSRVLTGRIHLIDDPAQAEQISSVLDELIEAAQQLQGLALAVVDSDAGVEAVAVIEEILGEVAPEAGGGKR